MIDFIVLSVIVLSIDYLYLSFIGGPPFLRMVSNIQNEKPVVNKYSAAVAYMFIIVALYKFAINSSNYFDSFLLGVVIYGIFDFTNMALFKKYDLVIALQDTIWGGVLFVTVHYIYRWIEKKNKKN